MHRKRISAQLGSALLLALALAGCGTTGPASQIPTSAPTTASTAATAASTSEPVSAPTTAPTAVSTAAPQIAPTAASATAPAATATATSAPSANALPNDVPWIRSGAAVYGDDEQVTFAERGLPILAYRLQTAPDGSYIAYISQEGQLALVDTRNYANHIRAEDSIGQPVGFAFSPDSRSLALTQLAADNTWQLQVRDLLSGTMRTLKTGPLHPATANDPLPLVPSPVAWTPNGLFVEQLLWASDAPPRDIALMNPADGSTRVLRADVHVQVYPSHDGTKVAVVTGALRMGEPPTTGIAILDVAGGQQQEIMPVQQALVRKIRWSHDDTKLLYAMSDDYQAPAASIHALNADGSGEQVIEVGAPGSTAAYSDIAWQNDQTALLLSPEADGYTHLYALPLSMFERAGLQQLAAFERGAASQQPDEIIYTPN